MITFKTALASLAVVWAMAAGSAAAQTAPAPAPDAAAAAPIEIIDFGIGPADAKVQIIEYASFTCPYCASFHANAFGKLKADYIDTGKVRFEYREVYSDRYGLWAAMVARCGGEMRYFGISSMIFDQQKEWAASDDPKVVVENLKKIGRAAGLDDAAMDICLNDKPKAEAMIAHYQKNFAADGIQGTPTLMINGTKHSNMPYDDLKAIIETELAK